jgi:hypothetical protein
VPPVTTAPLVVVIELLEADANELPAALLAVTVKVYEVEAVKPVTDIGDVALEPLPPEGVEVIKKLVAAGPLPAAVKVTVAVVDPVAVAVPIVGALGTAACTDCIPVTIFNI